MNIVVITDSKVQHFKKWSDVKKTAGLEKDQFTQIGTDYVAKMTDDTYQLAIDIRQLETVASQKVFTKDKFDITNWLQIITIIFLLFKLL